MPDLRTNGAKIASAASMLMWRCFVLMKLSIIAAIPIGIIVIIVHFIVKYW